MILVNGKHGDLLSVTDRGLAYGDGLFETIAVHGGKPQLLDLHWQRLAQGCDRLRIPMPDLSCLQQDLDILLADAATSNASGCVIKVIITRGSGGRGYRIPDEIEVTRIAMRMDWPYGDDTQADGIQCIVCNTRLSPQPALAGVKHLNRLEQVLARSEWTDDKIAEGLMLCNRGNIIEGTMSNVFFVNRDSVLMTPDLSACGIAGVKRENVLRLAKEAGMQVVISDIDQSRLAEFDEVFVTNSLIGIWPVTAIDEMIYDIGPVTRKLQRLLANND